MIENSLNGSAYSEAADETLVHLRELVAIARMNPGNELGLLFEESEAGAVSLSWSWPEEDPA